jgi:F-type H+-transporting ATPase subunit delta
MSDTRIAARYAKSLMEIAGESNVANEVFADLKSFEDSCNSNEELSVFLKSPIIKTADKKAALNKIFGGLNETTLLFFNLVTDKNRADLLPAIAKEYALLSNKKKGIINATVTTAVDLEKENESQIVDYIKTKTGAVDVELNKVVDSSIIGGVVIRFDDYLLDNSISTQINNLKQELNIA